jgi:transaldolase
MEMQALKIAGWGPNAYVKIPVTNTKGESTCSLIQKLSAQGIAVNVTAVMTLEQVKEIAKALSPRAPAVVSVFAGRIADTGIDPVPLMRQCLEALSGLPRAELLWASPRELLNVFQADEIGTNIITATPDVLTKLSLVGKDLAAYSLETVKMFYDDAVTAGYSL